ncbi:MAG: efflux RND transporter periplasmic adaptor subunit [Gammaproteobacteria bacterium]|nr:efflux RND transporter periplasmic adaptor subunit [Gammaproteobacteria bacterium]MDH3537463.1 efflux RND transporter periplasmic adaptor subunit [Gammaproteobacteria bacterium]
MTSRSKPIVTGLVILGLIGALAWSVYQKLDNQQAEGKQNRQRIPAPVEVAAIEVGSIDQLRSFTGTLEARSEFVVAPKISGRIEQLRVDLADGVNRGQVVAVLDDAESTQEVARARADLEVEKALNAESLSLLKIAERELKRLEKIQARGDVSESQLDITRSELVAKQALTEVTRARIARAEADLEAARIRLGYTQVKADWQGGNNQRVVAQRFVDAGETVSANAPLLRIVELNPITAVFFVTERDYAKLRVGQQASLDTDAFPGDRFGGSIERIAPVFSETTRQARVEMLVNNPDLRLKPGMFIRASVMLQRVENAIIIPEQALTRRDDQQGVFVVNPDGKSARWQAVEIGVRQGNKVQITGNALSGQVVVLGQQLLDDGAALRIVEVVKQ